MMEKQPREEDYSKRCTEYGYSKAKPSTGVWDCGSTLYDSFELNSFKRQLDSAIANSSRTLSMPHLSDHGDQRLQYYPPSAPKKPFRISRSLQTLFRSVFKPQPAHNKSNITFFKAVQEASSNDKQHNHGLFYYNSNYGNKSESVLSTIPEDPEIGGGLSPEISSLVTRSASDRFFPDSFGISCA